MQYTRLVSLNVAPIKKDSMDVMPISRENIEFKSKRRLAELNMIVRDNRDYLMSLVRDNGAGFFAIEKDNRHGSFESLAALFSGKQLDCFDYTQVMIRPIDEIAALKIAELFGFLTNVQSGVFELTVHSPAGKQTKNVTVNGFYNVIDAMWQVEDFKRNAA